ncbi:MAG TPA: type II secretion system major pseudopilin GspG [Opitutaceae bacterium]
MNRSQLRPAFTLVEILVALAILGMLVAAAVVKVNSALTHSQVSVAQLFVRQSLQTPLTTYRIDMGDYPTTDESLQALYTAPADKADRWHGPYADGKLPNDPWGEPYHYKYPGTHNVGGYDLWSSGPDHTDGTADDVTNW